MDMKTSHIFQLNALQKNKLQTFLNRLQVNLASQTIVETPPAKASVAAVFRWKEKEKENLQVLFIRRSIQERDRWSGHIAFPGGKRQKLSRPKELSTSNEEYETSLDTAKRETMEEIGLNLSLPQVHYIGCHSPRQSYLSGIHVHTHVFYVDYYDTNAPPIQPFQIDTREVADAYWVDVGVLFDTRRYRSLTFSGDTYLTAVWPKIRKWNPQYHYMAKKIIGNIVFGCMYLPYPPSKGSVSMYAIQEDRNAIRPINDFVLWGLTMRILVDLFHLGECELPLPSNPPMSGTSDRILTRFLINILRKAPTEFKPVYVVALTGAALVTFTIGKKVGLLSFL